MAESAPARARCCPRAGDEPCGKRRHDCVGPKSLRRPYGVSAGRRPALRCALRPGADRRSACAALHASSPLPASTARWGRAKPLGGDGQEPRCGRSAAKDRGEVAAAYSLRRASGGRLRRGAARDRPLLGALHDGLAQTRACRGGAVTRPAEIAATAASGGEDDRA